jgi:hypothetical protein
LVLFYFSMYFMDFYHLFNLTIHICLKHLLCLLKIMLFHFGIHYNENYYICYLDIMFYMHYHKVTLYFHYRCLIFTKLTVIIVFLIGRLLKLLGYLLYGLYLILFICIFGLKLLRIYNFWLPKVINNLQQFLRK